MRIFKYLLGILFLTLSSATAQKIEPDVIPIDTSVRHGILANGLKYYILRNGIPAKEVFMSLIVNVGHFDEDSARYEQAHLIEHLALRGTKNFPMGVRNFAHENGLNVNANTGVTTNYQLIIPSSDPEIVKAGMRILHDWAGGLSLRPEEIDEERSAVLREALDGNWQAKNAAFQTLFYQLNKNPLYEYENHRRIENIKKNSVKSTVDFYHKWYHPMHQAIVIVGDVKEDEIETIIQRDFSDLSNEGSVHKKDLTKLYKVSLSGENNLIVVNRGNGNGEKIDICFSRKREVLDKSKFSSEDVKTISVDRFFNQMVVNRLTAKILEEPEFGDYGIAYYGTRSLHALAGIKSFQINGNVSSVGEIKPLINFISRLLTQLQKFGFTEAEFDRVKDDILKSAGKTTKPSSFELLNQLAACYTIGRMVSINRNEIPRDLLKEITLKDVNERIKFWLTANDDTDIILSMPDSTGMKLPSETEVFTWIRDVESSIIKPFKIRPAKQLPIVKKSAASQIISIMKLPELGATKVVLKNGAIVILKHLGSSSIQKNEITFLGLKRSGAINDPAEKYLLANAWEFIGIGTLDYRDIKKWIEQKNKNGSLFVRSNIKPGEIKISGQATGDNTESLFHLVNLYITKPFPDQDAFQKFCAHSVTSENHKREKGVLFNDTLQTILTGIQPERHIIPSLQHVDFKRVFERYKKDFSNAAGFTFIITGNYDSTRILTFVEHYLGVLPGSIGSLDSKNQTKPPVSYGQSLFNSKRQITLIGDSTGNIDLKMVFRGYHELNEGTKLKLSVAIAALNKLLFLRLREKEKGVYHAFATRRSGQDNSHFFISIEFETAPTDVDRLTIAAREEITQLANGHLPDTIFREAVEIVRLGVSDEMNSVIFWNNLLADQAIKGKPSLDKLKRLEMLDNLSSADVIHLIRDSVNTSEFMLFTLL